MENRKARSRNYRAALVEMLESRLLMYAENILVNSQNYAKLQLYSQTGALLATGNNYPTQSSANAGDGGSAGALVVDKNDDIQLFTGVFEPFLQRSNGPLSASNGWTTEQTTIDTPGWSIVNRTFYGGLATIGNYVFTVDMATANAGAANGLIRFDASNNYAPTRFASGTDYCEVTLGMDGNIYAMVSPGGEPEHGTVNVFNPNTLALIRSIPLADYDDAAVVADAQGNIYTGNFGGTTQKISPAGVVLASAPIASTDLQISTDGKILSCAGNEVRVLDENLNILSGFTVASPVGAVFASWDTYQAPGSAPIGTHVAVTSSKSSSSIGQSVTLTATVTPANGSGETGTVQFKDGATDLGSPVTLGSSTGTAAYTTSALIGGSHSITAVYSGDANFATSTSPAFTQTVVKGTPTVTVSDAGGTYSGSAFPATALVNGAATLEGVAPTVAYYNGITATGTVLGLAPSAGGTYTVVATFPGSSDYAGATSSPVTFTITVPPSAPSITTQPTQQSVFVGQAASFTAAASGSPTPTVQWKFSSNGGASYSNIIGALSDTYGFTALISQTGYLYEAVFTNSQGSATTSPATLTVSPAPAIPVVTTEPTNQTVPTGQPGAFSAAASGNPIPTVQWQISTDGGASYANVSGAISSSYNFTTAAGQDGDLFRAVFTNSHGSATSAAASLTLAPPLTSPVVSSQPSDESAPSGNTFTFTAAATGNPAPTAQWQSSTDGTNFTDVPDATSAALILAATLAQNGTFYRAVFTNSQGSVTTSPATLIVTPTQFVVTIPPPDSVPAGEGFGFSVSVVDGSGNPDPGFSGNATVSLSESAGGTLGGQLTVPVANGVANFSGLTIDSVGSYSLAIASAAASTATTPTFSITTPLSKVVPTFTHVTLPPSAIIGGKLKSHVSVVIDNTGANQTGVFTIKLFADTTDTLDGNQQLLTTFAKNLSLHDGKSKSFSAQIKTLPASLPPGTYDILAEVVDPTGAINVSATSNSFVAAAPFVHITATAGAVIPASIVANHSGLILVTLANSGNEATTGPITLTLNPSADGVSSMPIALSSITSGAKIAANKSKTFKLHFKLTGQLAAGMYFPLVSVSVDGNDVTAVGPVKFTVE